MLQVLRGYKFVDLFINFGMVDLIVYVDFGVFVQVVIFEDI